VFQQLEKRDYALLLMDLNYTRDTTSGQEGLEVIPKIQAIDNTLPIVVMTAWATIDLAVEAMKRGARDFIPKPWDNERLLAIVRTQIELSSALRKGRRLEAANKLLGGNVPHLIAESPRMRPVLELVSRVAPSDANVLVTGENGTGKGLVARAIHALSNRASHTMITVNMGGLSEGIFESELFGHVKGAFTDAKTDRAGRFELADESTLFMDEIANIPLNLQAKLLRVIETGEFERVGSSKTLHTNVRIISADARCTSGVVGAATASREVTKFLRSRGRKVPPGFALSPQHDRSLASAVARAPRRHHAAGEQFPAPACGALSEGVERVRRESARCSHAASLARQCA
jgi:DNA-binding NtrC family response regulator